jgi:hypothetical protein
MQLLLNLGGSVIPLWIQKLGMGCGGTEKREFDH